jgi:hypothetical protein
MTIALGVASLWPPPRKFVRPKRSDEQERFAKRVYDLLQRPSRGKPQDGDRYGRHIKIDRNDFEDHLCGGVVLAVACVADNGANFLAFDCDECFGVRLPIYAKVLDRGLSQAAFATTGSTPARGKVVVTLAKRIPQAFAMELAREIQSEAKADPQFGALKPEALTCFPSAGDGSYCRIVAANTEIQRRSKIPLDLSGGSTDLSVIVPACFEAQALPVRMMARNGSGISAWAEAFLSQPFTGNEPGLLRAQLRLANEAVRIFGDEAAAKFAEWMEAIAKNSPVLRESVKRQLRRTDAFSRAVARLSFRESAPQWKPLSPTLVPGVVNKVGDDSSAGVAKVGKAAWRAYEAIATYALHQSLDPHAVAMSYERLADLADYGAKADARHAALQAEECELLYRLDPGTPRTNGRPGLSTLFCLRGEGETLTDAIEAGKRSAQYQERQAVTHVRSASLKPRNRH